MGFVAHVLSSQKIPHSDPSVFNGLSTRTRDKRIKSSQAISRLLQKERPLIYASIKENSRGRRGRKAGSGKAKMQPVSFFNKIKAKVQGGKA